MSPLDSLTKGRAALDPLLQKSGFSWVATGSGQGSGGTFASGKYVRGERELELHFRHGLGLFTYRVGLNAVSHEDYIRFLGHAKDAEFPGFPSDPLDGFRALANDINRWCGDFLNGPGETIGAAVKQAAEHSKLSGIARMSLP